LEKNIFETLLEGKNATTNYTDDRGGLPKEANFTYLNNNTNNTISDYDDS
jgi:hypothetical protein